MSLCRGLAVPQLAKGGDHVPHTPAAAARRRHGACHGSLPGRETGKSRHCRRMMPPSDPLFLARLPLRRSPGPDGLSMQKKNKKEKPRGAILFFAASTSVAAPVETTLDGGAPGGLSPLRGNRPLNQHAG